MGLIKKASAVESGRVSSSAPNESNVPKRAAAEPVVLQAGQPLHVALRPRTLKEVVGQDGPVRSLERMFAVGSTVPHAFLFTGPSGTGKTTLARIIGTMLGCEKTSVYELDAARFGSADSVRSLITGTQFVGMGKNGSKIYVVDEAHALSKAAWQTLLLSLEEPPPHVWWVLCTTEPEKVPATVKTRCHAYDLKPVKWDVLSVYLEGVVKSQKLVLAEGMVDVAARRSNGSVRQALVYLSTINGVTDKEEALKLIESVDSEEGQAFLFAKMICTGRGFTWEVAQTHLAALADENHEGVRLIVVNYAAKMLLNVKKKEEAERLCAVLAAFAGPYNQSERQAPLLLAVGSLCFGG